MEIEQQQYRGALRRGPTGLNGGGNGLRDRYCGENGLTSEATIAVVAGTELAAGAERWAVPPTPGRAMQPPIYTNRVDDTGPDLFIVEPEKWGEATLRAVDAEGSVLWQQHSPGIPLMGDSFGGVIAGVLYDVDQGDDFRALLRFGDAGGVPPWRYQSPGASSSRRRRPTAPSTQLSSCTAGWIRRAKTSGTSRRL